MLGRPVLRSARSSQKAPLACLASTLAPRPQPCQSAHVTVPAVQLPRPRAGLTSCQPCAVRFSSTTPKLHLWWRACTTSEDFAARAEWSKEDQAAFCEAYPTSSRSAWRSGGQFLEIAANEIGSAICHQNPAFSWADWRSIVYTKKGFEDMLIGLLIDVWPHRNEPDVAFTVIDTLLRLDQQNASDWTGGSGQQLTKTLQDAFEQPQRPSIWNELPSTQLQQDITDRHANHRKSPTRYVAPCTTLIGPEGIGKSYGLVQLALTQGMWISYASFADQSAPTYPRRSPIADVMANAREDQWVAYIIFQILFMNALSTMMISPAGLARIQYHEDFRALRKELASAFAGMASSLTLNTDHDSSVMLCDRFPKQASQLRAILRSTRTALVNRGWNQQPVSRAAGKFHHRLRYVIALDDVGNPTAGVDRESLHAFHRAAQAVFMTTAPSDTFFVVMVDTAAKPGDMPVASAEVGVDFANADVHAPIYRLDTWDIYSEQHLTVHTARNLDGTEKTVSPLLRHGRPLWGAILDSSQTSNVGDVIRVAASKLQWTEQGKPSKAHLLALLRARLGFEVNSPQMHEELSSRWMNYLLEVNKRRDHVVTIQPPEPVVAHAAAQCLADYHTRLSALQTLVDAVTQRTVKVGNAEETTAALMLLFALDRTNPPDVHLPRSVQAMELLSSLLGTQFVSKIRSIEKVDRVVRDGRVYFSHFAQLSRPPTPELLREAYIRGTAFYAPPRFPGGGLLIPICVMGGRKMSVLHVRVGPKANADDYTQLTTGLDSMMLPGHPLNYLNLTSVISLHMDLTHGAAEPPAPLPMPGKKRALAADDSDEPPSALIETRVYPRNIDVTQAVGSRDLVVYVPGLSGAVYPFLAPPTSTSDDTLLERMTNIAVVSTLRKLTAAHEVGDRAVREDRYTGPLMDLASRVHAMALAGQRNDDAAADGESVWKKMREQEELQAKKAAESMKRAAVLQRRANKRERKERMSQKASF